MDEFRLPYIFVTNWSSYERRKRGRLGKTWKQMMTGTANRTMRKSRRVVEKSGSQKTSPGVLNQIVQIIQIQPGFSVHGCSGNSAIVNLNH